MIKPRRDGSAEGALGVALLALVFLKLAGPGLQMTGARLTGAVMANHTSTSSFEFERRMDLHSIGGDRGLLWGANEHVAALHLLVVLPAKEVTVLDRPPRLDGSPLEHTIGGTYRLDDGAHRGAVVPAEATYDLVRRTATIGGVRYRLSRGNLFVVRLGDDLQPVVTQLHASFGDLNDQQGLLRAFRAHTRSDAEVQRALSAFQDPPVRRGARRGCGRAKPPTAAT